MTDLTDAVDRLQAVPLEDFVEERKRLAKELRAEGERDAAAELAKLPKPSPPAWALNQFAREQPEAMGAWLDVAEALRAESAAPGAGLREAMAAHREATTQLVKAVRDHARPNGRALSEPMVERVRALLQGALTDADEADRLRAGRIVEGDAGELELPAPAREAPRKRTAKGDRAAERQAAEDERRARELAERRAELERALEDARERLETARADAAERDEAAAAAAERLEEARRTLHRSESEAEAARDAAEEAREAAGDAEREADTLAGQLRKLDDS